VVCDKKLNLFHHADFINQFTEFIEVDFPGHGSDVITDFKQLGNLVPTLEAPCWWAGRIGKNTPHAITRPRRRTIVSQPKKRGFTFLRRFLFMILGERILSKALVSIRQITHTVHGKIPLLKSKNGKPPMPESEFHHISNVRLNKGSKLVVGILIAKKYDPEYVLIFDADDYVGNDISAYVNTHPGENGWIMAHGYKMLGNRIAPYYRRNSLCGTGNIYNFRLLLEDISPKVSEKSSQIDLFQHVDSKFLFHIIGAHLYSREYYEEKGCPFLEYPTRSVVQLLGHTESSEVKRRALRGEPANVRLQKSQKYGLFSPFFPTITNYFNILSHSKPRVFCLGFHKTGTTSLEALLQDLGYRVSRHYKSFSQEYRQTLERGDLSELKQLAELYDAFQDTPWFLFYKEFDQWYPDTKFILTTRNSESWWASYLNYFREINAPVHEYIYGTANPIGNKEVFIERFERHTKEVLEYFKDRPEDLLGIDISKGDALQEVCDFLGKSTILKKMPHKNNKLRKSNTQTRAPVRKLVSSLKKADLLSMIKVETFQEHPIIIGGCPRSGIRLMLTILSCHPHLHALSNDLKLNYLNRHPLLPQRIKKSSNNHYASSPFSNKHLKHKLYTAPIHPASKRWAATSFLSVLAYDRILEHYGEKIRIINMVRDGRDVVTENHEKVPEKFTVSPERWVFDVNSGKRWEKSPLIMTVRYEDLVQNFEKTITSICDFIGEKDASPLLDYPKGATIMQDKYWIGRWKQPYFADRIEKFFNVPNTLENLRHYCYLE
jgi:hypothetical protein